MTDRPLSKKNAKTLEERIRMAKILNMGITLHPEHLRYVISWLDELHTLRGDDRADPPECELERFEEDMETSPGLDDFYEIERAPAVSSAVAFYVFAMAAITSLAVGYFVFGGLW
jgi:hypothetical protein